MAINLEDLVRHIRDLPSLSAVVVELLTSMEQEDIDVHVLGSKIASDQALTAKTLRLANSSFYGMPSKVTTIHQAISVLGFHSIRTLVTACAVTAAFPATGASGFDFKLFWRHSVATAVSAKFLAPHCKINPDTGFTAGLLHDIGTLVLAMRFPNDYAAMLSYRHQQDCTVQQAEQAKFGLDHAMVGSALAAYWKFPESMQSAVAEHHESERTGPMSLALLVHVANTFAHALDLSEQEDDLAPPISQAVWDMLRLSEADTGRLFASIEAAYAEMCQILVA